MIMLYKVMTFFYTLNESNRENECVCFNMS